MSMEISSGEEAKDSFLMECDLWALPQPAHSRWFARLDWYLNWRMLKGLSHAPQPAPEELARIMTETGVRLQMDAMEASAPLLVASSGRLPAGKCLVLPFGGNLKSWLAELHSRSFHLQAAKVRIFLPNGASIAEAQSIWNGFSSRKIEAHFTTDEATL